MAEIITRKEHTSGIPLGGIGTGSVELCSDGEFHSWQISNQKRITTVCFEKEVDDGEKHTGALSFYIRAKETDKKPIVRKLGMKCDTNDFTYRMFAWNKPVESITFNVEFPVCKLEYNDCALPCKVSLNAVSPFVPHNSDLSATPGFYLDFTVENTSESEIDISLAGRLIPSFMNVTDGRKNRIILENDIATLISESKNNSRKADCGNVSLSLVGECNKSYITADFTSFMKEYVSTSSFGLSQESFLFGFRENGVLPNTSAGIKPSPIPLNLNILTDRKIDRILKEYLQYPFAQSLLNRISYISPDLTETRRGKIKLLSCFRRQLFRMKSDFGSAALCGSFKLKANEKKTIRFVFSWYFPNLYSDSTKLGHYYENLFKSSYEANKCLINKSDEIFDKAVKFSNLLYKTNLQSIYPDAWSGNLSTIVKSSAYLKNGKFGLWEGLGFCGFHTTDITYHASFGLLALFPDLQKKQLLMGAEFQRKDGRVHHCFQPSLNKVDNGFDRVDMNMQFVLMAVRDYMFTGDRDYIVKLWSNITRAMKSIEELDKNHDGLPDYDTKRNTYDAWNFFGTPVYISILWLSALKAAIYAADKLSDNTNKIHWQEILKKGKESLEKKLWNGEYYNLWCDNNKTDEAIMTDQLDGEWFLRMIGIEGNFSDERVRNVLEYIFKENFDKEAGLINASCPPEKNTSIFTYHNCQADAVWTGINYLISALAISVGKKEIADTIMECVYNNQYRLGYLWDHWECGHHYTRPMSSWTTLNALLGLKIDAENRTVTVNPILENTSFPLCLHDLLASVKIENGNCYIECVDGDISSWNFVCGDGKKCIIK